MIPTETAAPAAPVEAPAGTPGPAGEPTQVAPTPTTAAEARALLSNATMPVMSPAQAKAVLQDRNEAGQFVAAEVPAAADAPADPPAAVDTPAADPAAEPVAEPAQPAAADAPAEGHVRIPIPEGHALSQRGLTHVDVPKELEDYHRWAINNEVRRNQVVQWETYARGLRQENVRLQAEIRARSEFTEVIADPKINHMLRDLEQTYGKEAAAALRRGLETERLQPKVQEYTNELTAKDAEAQAYRVAADFTQAAFETAVQQFPLWTEQEFDAALAGYGAMMEARGINDPDLNAFTRYAAAIYVQKPEVQASLSAQQTTAQKAEAERIRQEEREKLAKEEREKLEAAAAARRNNPMGRIPVGAESGLVVPAITGAQTAVEARKGLFDRTVRRP